MRNLIPAWDMAKLPGPSGPRIVACYHLSRLAVFGGRWEKGTLSSNACRCKNWLVICLFVCWYFVYNASYALRKNKFLTFLIVIQLVCFVGDFLLIFSVLFWFHLNSTEFIFHRIITCNFCVHAIANFILGYTGTGPCLVPWPKL